MLFTLCAPKPSSRWTRIPEEAAERTEHDVVLRVSVHLRLVQVRGEDFDVAAAAVDVLLVLHRELDHQRFTFIAEGVEATGRGVEPGVLSRLETFGRQNTRLVQAEVRPECEWIGRAVVR